MFLLFSLPMILKLQKKLILIKNYLMMLNYLISLVVAIVLFLLNLILILAILKLKKLLKTQKAKFQKQLNLLEIQKNETCEDAKALALYLLEILPPSIYLSHREKILLYSNLNLKDLYPDG